MAKAFRKLEIELNGTRYVLNRTASEMLLAEVEKFGDECGAPCMRLRDDLRAALAIETDDPTPTNPFDAEEPLITEETTIAVALVNAKGENVLPRCFFCGCSGVQVGPDEDDLWRCYNAKCFRSEAGNFTRPVFEGGVQ